MLIAVVLIAVLAFCVSAVAGGGAGLMLMPLLRLLVPVAQVPAALSIGTAVGSLARLHAFRRQVRWDIVRWFAPAALPMAALGAWALSRFESAYVELIIGLFLLANLPALFRRAPLATEQAIAPSPLRLVILGLLAGLVSGFTGAVGLLFNRSYARMGLAKSELVATRAANEIALHALKILLYASFGLLTRPALFVGALIAAAAVIAAYLMRRLLPHIDERLFRRIGDVAMVMAGVAMFALSSRQIAAIHRIWAAEVRLGAEREYQFYAEGRRRFVFEIEDDGALVIERPIAFADLEPGQRRRAAMLAKSGRIALIEEVIGWHGRSIEVYVRHGDATAKHEIGSDPRR